MDWITCFSLVYFSFIGSLFAPKRAHYECRKDQNLKVVIISTETSILGETNINTFCCSSFQDDYAGQLNVVSRLNGSRLDFKGFMIHMRVDQFDCGQKLMTKDFKEILRCEEFPTILLDLKTIEFKSRDGFYSNNPKANSAVNISLAGNQKTEQIRDGEFIRQGDYCYIKGRKDVKMTDFGLEPPTKFWGAVVVKDVLTIDFTIKVRLIEV